MKLLLTFIYIIFATTIYAQNIDPSSYSPEDIIRMAKQLEAYEQKMKEESMESNADKDRYIPGEEYTPTYNSTLNRIRERGYIKCGVRVNKPGFGHRREIMENGIFVEKWDGFDLEFCKVFAIAVFNDESKVVFVETNSVTRFQMLNDGSVDVILSTTTYNFSRDVELRIEFMPIVFYDGAGFLTWRVLGVKSIKQMNGASVCVNEGSTAIKNVLDFAEKNYINLNVVVVPTGSKIDGYYLNKKCEVIATDKSGLVGYKATFKEPRDHVILPETISKEPLAPAVKHGDQAWEDLVRWSVYVTLIAEELNLKSDTIDLYESSSDPEILRFFGKINGSNPEYPNLGSKLKIDARWAYNIIKKIGNYAEIYERYFGQESPYHLKRLNNNLYQNGGLHYVPPFQ